MLVILILLLQLTGPTGTALYVNVESIVALARYPEGKQTEISLASGTFVLVRETPEEVLKVCGGNCSVRPQH